MRRSTGLSLLEIARRVRGAGRVTVTTTAGRSHRGKVVAVPLHPCVVLDDGTTIALAVVKSIEEASDGKG